MHLVVARIAGIGLLSIVACAPGCARPTLTIADANREATAAPAPPEQRRDAFEQVELGESLEGRPLTMQVMRGDAPQRILILGGIHGSEPTSVDVAQGLLDLLRERPELARGRTVAVYPISNPDGYARRSRYNANRIDVNRNFAATNFKPAMAATSRNGTSPNSEPETRAIVRAIEMIEPDLLISIHSIDRGRECNNYDGPAEQIAKIMTEHNGYPPVASIGYPTPGSLGSYAGIDKQIPMITLELPRTLPGEAAWANNREALLAAIEAAE